MSNFLNNEFILVQEYFMNFSFKSLLDLVLVFFLIVKLIEFLSKTRAVHAVKGIVAIYIAQIISELIGLTILNEFLGYATAILWVSLVFIFNKEFRMLLEGIGRFKTSPLSDIEEKTDSIKILSTACDNLSRNKIGSLIVLENDAPLEDYINTGHRLNAQLSEEIIMLIFENHSRFHDGAMIIKDSTIISVKCFLPLSKNMNKKTSYGTRHRAAAGITEISDSIAIVTSEETGKISIASKGIVYPVKSANELEEKYRELMKENYIKEKVKKININDSLKMFKNK